MDIDHRAGLASERISPTWQIADENSRTLLQGRVSVWWINVFGIEKNVSCRRYAGAQWFRGKEKY